MNGNHATDDVRTDIDAALAESGIVALVRAGAPVLVAKGASLRPVHANAAALALFGAQSLAEIEAGALAPKSATARALAERVKNLPAGVSRIQRLEFARNAATAKLTFICRRANTKTRLYILAGLGLRLREAPAQPALAVSAPATAGGPESCAELKRALENRYPGLKPARFLWRTDARNVVTEVTPPLAEIFGGPAASLVGRELIAATRELGLDPERRLATALKGRATFSGVELMWPIEGAGAAAPVSLGALPAFDRDKGFDGWRGFGVIQLDRLAPIEEAEPPIPEEEPAPDWRAPTLWRGAPAEAVVVRRSRGAQLQARIAALETSLRQRETEAADVMAIVQSSADGVALFNTEGVLLGLNAAAEKLFGRNRDEAGSLRDLIAPDSHAALAAALAALSLAAPAPRLRGLTRAGEELALQANFVRLSGGEKFCAVFRKLSDAGDNEEALREAKLRAEAENRAKTEYLTAVTHELRTPLNAILGFTEVIMDERFGPVGNARYREYIKDIHASGAHVMSLVNDLLDLSRIEAGKLELKFQAVDINQIVAECVSLIQPQANRERVITRLALAPGLPAALADERSVRQIVLNLLANAVRYNEPGGQVIVSTASANGMAVVRVKDTGIGMSDAELLSALEPFRQLSAKTAGGSGLGLPLTKALAEANHAEFVIRSRKDEGTLVEVGFPHAGDVQPHAGDGQPHAGDGQKPFLEPFSEHAPGVERSVESPTPRANERASG